jgi:branched-subunit amino acid aminotransferase/4-amino-4-deoxychorismate lyase
MGELSPVLEVDGRTIGEGGVGPMTQRLQEIYSTKTASEGEPLPF